MEGMTWLRLHKSFKYECQQTSGCLKYRSKSTLKKNSKEVSKLCRFYVMLYIRTAGMKQDGKIQIFSSEKVKWEAGEPWTKEKERILGKEICKLRKNGNAISKEKHNFLYVYIKIGLGRSTLLIQRGEGTGSKISWWGLAQNNDADVSWQKPGCFHTVYRLAWTPAYGLSRFPFCHVSFCFVSSFPICTTDL